MFRNGRGIVETAHERQTSVSSQGNGRNGHHHTPGMLSWYFAEPAAGGQTYLLTASGYVIVPTGLSPSQKGFDKDELIG
jgi:hypothetical protein